jgi:hypothetical protein
VDDFTDESTPLPPPDAPARDPWFPTGRQPRIAPGANHPHARDGATVRMWKQLRGADTERMSREDLLALIPALAAHRDPMQTMRVDAAMFVERPPASPWHRWRLHATAAAAFAAGLIAGLLIG